MGAKNFEERMGNGKLMKIKLNETRVFVTWKAKATGEQQDCFSTRT